MGIKKARTKEIKSLKADQLGIDLRPALLLDRIYTPERVKQSQIFSGDAQTAAHQLVEKLRFEARVL